VDLAPQHIAAYSLIVEDGTPLACMGQAGGARMNFTDLEAVMYERAMELLGMHGCEHYEVSNYALPGFRCRHNGNYWSHVDYLGFGPSAQSFWKGNDGTNGRRWWNVADLSTYLERLKGGIPPADSEEQVGLKEMLNERIFLGLRSSGADLARLRQDFGYDLKALQGATMRWLLDEKMAVLQGDILRLTPKGYLLCDEICSKLLP
jgi:oxygen-independent coproporphyrinogen-3 oxidase